MQSISLLVASATFEALCFQMFAMETRSSGEHVKVKYCLARLGVEIEKTTQPWYTQPLVWKPRI